MLHHHKTLPWVWHLSPGQVTALPTPSSTHCWFHGFPIYDRNTLIG
ncbi:hypothetical protein GFS31_05600 [Leptolyngbya sp. BL0902]|nr:hypothetical protein GFS31_05600 [Leptolyngbya sp. BL0902]